MPTNRLLIMLGGIILMVGSRLPWISVPVLYGVEGPAFEAIEIGWEDNGYTTAFIGLVLVLIAGFWRGKTGKIYSIPAVILAVLAVLMVAGCFYSILKIDPAAGFFAATKIGIYVTLTGALLALIGTLFRTAGHAERQAARIPSATT